MRSLAGWLARMLEPEEREAVLGDLAEAGDPAVLALAGLIGLIARRQVTLWKSWRPWLALCLAIPLGWFLGRAAIGAFRGLDVWILMNRTDLDPAVLAEYGMSVRHSAFALLRDLIVLTGSAWASGVSLGWLARRAAWVHAVLFVTLTAFYPLARVLHFGDFWLLAKLGTLVMVPATLGMRLGRKAAA